MIITDWKNILPKDLEFAERAFKHNVKKEEYEILFRHPFYKEKYKDKGETRYRIIGKSSHGKYIFLIAVLIRKKLLMHKLKIISGREATEDEKRRYRERFQ